MPKVRKAKVENAGPGSRGVENTAGGNTGCSGKHEAKVENAGSKWKTGGLSGKNGVLFLSPKYEFPHYNPQHLGLKRVSLDMQILKSFVSRAPF